MVQEFLSRFNGRFESGNCFELIGCDFGTSEGQQKFKEKRLVRKCIHIAVFAAQTALSILREQGYLPEQADSMMSRLAPCGLSCGSCLAYEGGPIQQLALSLGNELGDNFAAYAERFAAMDPVFGKYSDFRELLDYFGRGSCSGCREKGCLFKDCKVTACVREKNVDYCFQCSEFPCDRHGMPAGLAERWQANNEKMKEIGPENWFCGCKDKPRYP